MLCYVKLDIAYRFLLRLLDWVRLCGALLGHCTCWLDKDSCVVVLLIMIWLTRIHACDVIHRLKVCIRSWIQVCWDVYYLFELVRMFCWLVGFAWLCMVVLKSVKRHVLTKCPSLVCFALICAFDLILSTYGVLSQFSSFFPNILGSSRWSVLKGYLKKACILDHPSRKGPHFSRAMSIFDLMLLY